jgi:putative aldouronate transport system substrate-binding protein
MEFLDLVNTNAEIYNLICYGVEGKHWKWVDQDTKVIEKVADSGYNPDANWEFGNAFNAYYFNAAQIPVVEEQKKINQTAVPSPVLGFTFDKKSVETELATFPSADPVWAELFGGTVADVKGKIEEGVNILKDAGVEKVITEVQTQIDAWKKTL